MSEINDLFTACQSEIENNTNNLCFELGSEHFATERDYEEIKILFNLARISIENPKKEFSDESLLTSDLRKITNTELEKVLVATEKAIDIPVITLSAIKKENSKNISRILLNSDEKDSLNIFKSHAKKIIPAGPTERILSFGLDLTLMCAVSAAFTFVAINFHFTELKNLENILPVISIAVSCMALTMLFYPIATFILFGNTPGQSLLKLKLTGNNYRKVKLSQIFVRSATLPLAIISFSIFNTIRKKSALHDHFAGTLLVR